MGMNGYFGIRYMLAEVEPHLRAGDVVVIAYEWETYYEIAEGNDDSLLIVVKANPGAIRYLDWRQRARLLGSALPYVARQKALRLLREGLAATTRLAGGSVPERDGATALSNEIEMLRGFNAMGDLTSHLGVEWPFLRAGPAPDLTEDGVESQAVEEIEGFAQRMEERDVSVIVSFTPTMRRFYAQHAGAFEDLYRRLRETPPIIVPSPPSAYTYEEPLFFDTAYHLKAEGRGLRTHRLAEDIKRALPGDPLCTTPSGEMTQ
jgi:hypothetical protein